VLGGYNDVVTGGEATGGVLTLDGFTSGGTLELTSNAVTTGEYVVSNAAVWPTTAAATFNIDLLSSASLTNAGLVSANNVTSLNIAATDSKASHVGVITDTITVLDTAATSITVTGNANLVLTAAGGTALDTKVGSINASALNGSLTASTNGVVSKPSLAVRLATTY
jgi:hypothetical protein